MNTKKNILLLTDVQPSKNYSGALLSLQATRFLLEEKHKVFCIAVKSDTIKEILDEEVSQKLNTLILTKPIENAKNQTKYQNDINRIVDSSIKFIQKNHIDMIWCPIQGETILKVLIEVHKKTKIPYVAQIWDPIEWILNDLKYSKANQTTIINNYYACLKKARGVISASHSMTELYKKKYGIISYPLYSSFEINSSVQDNTCTNNYVITMSGQTYAEKSVNSLFQALNAMNWEYKGKPIIFKYYGNNTPKIFINNKHVKMGGYLSQSDLIKEQSKATLLYCPYFFDNNPALQLVSKLSFPSKISTYILAKRPILIHADKATSVYKMFDKYDGGYLLNSVSQNEIVNLLKKVFSNVNSKDENQIISNSIDLFNEVFSKEKNKANLFKAFNIECFKGNIKRVLEVNYVDLPGKRFNGYDLMNYINNKPNYYVNQLVTYKTSDNNSVIKLFNNYQQEIEYQLLDYEKNQLSIHSCLSMSSPSLLSKDVYKNSDVVHLHQIHNTKLSLISLLDICNKKPTIITIHDPWTFTGRCVHYYECDAWKTGCNKCNYLDTLFPLKEDNCSYLWNLKKYVYDNIDVDYVVTSQYMLDLFNSSPLTKGKRVHYIPFGIDSKEFNNSITQTDAKKHYNIPNDHYVLFHRAQKDFKGTNYLLEALKMLKTEKNVTIITCSEIGLLNEIKNKYNVIDLGNINSTELLFAYNACDIMVMPSIGESFGMMAIEAMACSKPVIVFNNTALPSIVHAPECGIAVENKNATKLSESIKMLIENDNERQKRGKLARKIVEEEYNIDNYHKKIIELYENACARKHQFNSILDSKYDDSTNNAKNIMIELNSLSKKLFKKNSNYYQLLHFNINMRRKSGKIDFSDINVQKIINSYNNKLFKIMDIQYTALESTPKYRGMARLTIVRMIKRFHYLLWNDRKLLIKTIKRKLSFFNK